MLAISVLAALILVACTAKGVATQDSYPSASPSTLSTPSGTYTARGLELRNVTATFSGQTLEIYSDYFDFVGKETYKYSLENDGKSIALTNLATGQSTTYDFKYNQEIECVVLGGVQYWK